VLAWKGLNAPKPDAKSYDPTTAPGFPADTRIVPYQAPTWASTGETIFVGTRPRTRKPPKDKDKAKENKEKPEVADVEVWHFKDVRIIPEQKLRADRDRKKGALAAWWLTDGKFVPLGGDWAEDVTPLKGGKHALAVDETPHDPSRMFGRPYSDVYLVDTRTGERKMIAEHLRFPLGSSPEGRYVLYFRDDQYWAFDSETGKTVGLTQIAPTSFANREDDHPTPERGPYGSGGFGGVSVAWTKGDASILIYDRYDLWEARLDGSKVTRLTRGAEEEVEHRVVARLDPREESVDPSKPLYLTLHGEWTKKQGLARLDLVDEPKVDRAVWLDKAVGRLIKARSADVLAYVVQGFDDPPDLFACGPDLKGARQVSETNPFQKDYAWGRAELVEYANSRGERLQGILHYPAGFEPGKTYPMVVYMYEKLSRNLHNYAVPSDR
jgi:dipeptidyl aminopeptidase/acylaminoacyl peptidase